MNIKTKGVKGTFKVKDGGAEGTFSAYGNTFDHVDLANDMTMKGAFTKCIEAWNVMNEQPQLLGQHGHTQNPIGIITSMKEDVNGLLFEGEFCLQTQAGLEAYELVKMGALKRFSIGYNVIKQRMNTKGVNELHELDVHEISLVTFACDTNSLVQSVKSAVKDGEDPTRLIQKALQEAGFSKRAAQSAMTAAIKSKSNEDSMPNKLEQFKTKAAAYVSGTHELKVKADMSLNDFAKMIRSAVEKSVRSESVYAYVRDIFHNYVIVEIYDYSDEPTFGEYYFLRVSYTVDVNDEVLVGSGEHVVMQVSWLNDAELAATKSITKTTAPKVKAEQSPKQENEPEHEPTKDHVPEVPPAKQKSKSIDLSDIQNWFT